jgi:hypothetical protein
LSVEGAPDTPDEIMLTLRCNRERQRKEVLIHSATVQRASAIVTTTFANGGAGAARNWSETQ